MLDTQISRDGLNNTVRGVVSGIESAANSQNLNDVTGNNNTQSTNAAFIQVFGMATLVVALEFITTPHRPSRKCKF